MNQHPHVVPVVDRFGAAADPAMPFLTAALDPVSAEAAINSCLARSLDTPRAALARIQMQRYKPGRRCLIEYELLTPEGIVSLLGKVRAKGTDHRTFNVMRGLRHAGFGDTSEDSISVPEPIGVIAQFQMWLQIRAPGQAATGLIPGPGGVTLARRIAEAAHKLHRTVLPTNRSHSLADELVILRDRLQRVAESKPKWRDRLQKLVSNSELLAQRFPLLEHVGIHRDFYADHVIVDGDRLWLVDFDLYCRGHAALDIGNFSAHITEQSLRTLGNPLALREQEQALENRFVELAGEEHRWPVRAYAALTLARHVYISTRFPDRESFSAPLLDLAEASVTELLRDKTG